MNGTIDPPRGSRLSVEWTNGQPSIVAPPPARGLWQVIPTAFLLFWLGGWTLGGVTVGAKLAEGRGSAFEGLWLAGWAAGEAFALFYLYRLLRPSIPERYVLQYDGLGYDSGVAPLRMSMGSFGYGRKPSWRDAWPKRVKRVFPREALETLRLREGGDANRLTIDVDADRYDLARDCTEVEREWLYRTLKAHYRLPDAARD